MTLSLSLLPNSAFLCPTGMISRESAVLNSLGKNIRTMPVSTCLPKGKYQAFFEDQELRTMFMLNVESLQPCRSFSRYLYPLCALCSNTPLTGKRNWLRLASLYRPGVLWQSLLVSNLWHSWPSILLWLKEAAPQGSRDLRKIQMRCGEPCETWKTQQFLVLCFKHLFCCLMQVLCTSTGRSLSVNIWFNVV